jgi:hypothetical protein
LVRRRKKILNDPQVSHGFVSVFYFAPHILSSLSSNIRRRRYG